MIAKALLCFVASLVVAYDGSRTSELSVPSPAQVQVVRRECQHALPNNIGDQDLDPGFADLSVPELHDCQRFLVRDSSTRRLRYDSLFAIIAPRSSPTVERFDSLESVVGSGNVSLAVAAILAYGDYNWLGIKRGISCLYFWREYLGRRGARYQWHAKLVPEIGRPGGPIACNYQGHPAELHGTVLHVFQYRSQFGRTPDDYPKVARWDRDSQHDKQYMGVSCPDLGWCEVYNPPVSRSPTLWARMGGFMNQPRRLKAILDIKGWYDHQVLASAQRNVPAPPPPTAIEGFVWPDTLLGSWDNVDQFTRTNIRVGQVALFSKDPHSPELDRYREKFGFARTNIAGPYNTIFLCRDEHRVGCVPPGTPPARIRKCTCFRDVNDDAKCNDADWWAKVVPAGFPEDTVYHGVCRYDMPEQEIPGTARWRWLANDDGTWFRCAVGCCEKTGEG